MKKAFGLLIAVSFVAFVPSSSAADFWKKKSYLEWKDDEVQKMLNDSPWSKHATVPGGSGEEMSTGGSDATVSAGRRRGSLSSAGGIGAPSGEGGEASVRRTGSSGGRGPGGMSLLVQWTSALPVKQAMVRLRFGRQTAPSGDAAQLLAREEEGYFLTVRNLPRKLSGVDPAQLREALLKMAILNRKGGESIRPSDVQTAKTEDGAVIVVFVFPRSTPITLEDKNVEFVLRLGSTEFKCKFDLRDMVLDGKLQL